MSINISLYITSLFDTLPVFSNQMSNSKLPGTTVPFLWSGIVSGNKQPQQPPLLEPAPTTEARCACVFCHSSSTFFDPNDFACKYCNNEFRHEKGDCPNFQKKNSKTNCKYCGLAFDSEGGHSKGNCPSYHRFVWCGVCRKVTNHCQLHCLSNVHQKDPRPTDNNDNGDLVFDCKFCDGTAVPHPRGNCPCYQQPKERAQVGSTPPTGNRPNVPQQPGSKKPWSSAQCLFCKGVVDHSKNNCPLYACLYCHCQYGTGEGQHEKGTDCPKRF